MPLHHPLADRQPHPRAGVLVPPVQPLEDLEDPLPVLGRDADAIVAHREDPLLTGPLGRDVDARRAVAELQRVADQVLEELDELDRVGEHRGQVIMGHHRPLLRDGPAEIGPRLVERRPGPHLPKALRLGGDAGIAKQAVDQGLHPRGAVDRVVDVLVGPLVEPALVPLGQQIQEAGDHAEGLLEVVGGDVGELLELGVGPGQLLGVTLEQGRGPLPLGNVAGDDRRPHHLAGGVDQGRSAHGHVQEPAVFAPDYRLVMLDPLTPLDLLDHHRPLIEGTLR